MPGVETNRKPDFSGYVTKYNILCTDGRTIRPGAFKELDGQYVPLVYMHNHKDLDNVLGKMLLEHRDDGVYGYGFFNSTDRGKTGKTLVDHGDISCLSIFANQLKQQGGDVLHGNIQEVSLVLAGANRGAVIDSRLAHSDNEDEEAFICMGDMYSDGIYVNDEDLSFEDYIEHYGVKGMKWGEHKFLDDESSKGMFEKAGEKVKSLVSEARAKENEIKKAKAATEMVENAAASVERKTDTGSGSSKSDTDEKSSTPAGSRLDTKDVGDILDRDDVKDRIRNRLTELSVNRKDQNDGEIVQPKTGESEKGKDLEKDDSSEKDKDLKIDSEEKTLKKIADRVKEKIAEAQAEAQKRENKTAKGSEDDGVNQEYKEFWESILPTLEKMRAQETKERIAEKIKSKLRHSDSDDPEEGAEELLDELEEKLNAMMHDSLEDGDYISHGESKTYSQVLSEMNEDQLGTVYYILKKLRIGLTGAVEHSDESDEFLSHADPQTISAIFNAMTDEQKDTVYYLANQLKAEIENDSAKHSDEEDNSMKENVFDMSMENKGKTLSHAEEVEFASAVFADFKRTGSLKDAFLAHAGDYGIDQIDWLFPDAKNVTNTPIWIKRPDGWVPKVMNAVSHSPFSRIKSMFADITEPDARAKGYIKGNRKTEEVFGLLKRTTTPTTVYKKQKLDRDDIIDITDFDVVAWLKTEMRGMLDEELARAILVSDGRSPASDDKINEQNIRPIWTDDDLFVIRKAIAVTSSTTVDEKCKQFIRAAIKARKDYRGSGNPVLYTTEDILTDMLLMEDNLGHPLYETEEKLCRKLRVKEIVTVPVMENLSRVVNGMNMELMGIIVNLTDYKVGADKGGAINMFDDFDIDYNQQKYLIETRCSGALTVPYSAIVIEATSSAYLEIEPDDPDTIRYGKDVADLQDNVLVNDDSVSGTLKYVTGYTGFSGDVEEQSGNYLAFNVVAPNGATNTVQLVGGGASGNIVTISDDYVVARIKSKNTKLVLTSTINGLTVTKTYSLRLLKLLSE